MKLSGGKMRREDLFVLLCPDPSTISRCHDGDEVSLARRADAKSESSLPAKRMIALWEKFPGFSTSKPLAASKGAYPRSYRYKLQTFTMGARDEVVLFITGTCKVLGSTSLG